MLLLITGAILGRAFPIFFPEPFMKLKNKVTEFIRGLK